jgi:hypothetical protein
MGWLGVSRYRLFLVGRSNCQNLARISSNWPMMDWSESLVLSIG